LRGKQSDLTLSERAIRQGWPLSPEKRQQIIEECARLALHASRERDRIQAMRVLVMMDSLNIRREQNDQDDDQQAKRESVERMRALMNNPEARAALEQLQRITLSTSPTVHEDPPPALLDDSDSPPGG
jgi:hypothetical protein